MDPDEIDPTAYVSGGYYVSVDARLVDATGIRLRSTTMASDHTPSSSSFLVTRRPRRLMRN